MNLRWETGHAVAESRLILHLKHLVLEIVSGSLQKRAVSHSDFNFIQRFAAWPGKLILISGSRHYACSENCTH